MLASDFSAQSPWNSQWWCWLLEVLASLWTCLECSCSTNTATLIVILTSMTLLMSTPTRQTPTDIPKGAPSRWVRPRTGTCRGTRASRWRLRIWVSGGGITGDWRRHREASQIWVRSGERSTSLYMKNCASELPHLLLDTFCTNVLTRLTR